MKKCIALFAALLLLLTGCAAEAPPTTEPTTQPTTLPTETEPAGRASTELVILLPDEEALDWAEAGEDLKMLLENLYYQVELLYAGSDGWEQADQMTAAIERGVDGIILAPVESATLTDACQLAADRDIPIIAYDRLVMDTEAVSYYVSFDYRAIGNAIGEYIVAETGLDNLDPGTCLTAEFFMGSPEDSKALLLYNGIMDQLQDYIDRGFLVAKSGRTAFEDTCVVDWDAEVVRETFSGYLSEYYKTVAPDIICTVDDTFAEACIAALEEQLAEDTPMVTGIGYIEANRGYMESGRQTLTVSMDMYLLNEQLVQTVDAVMTGKTPEVSSATGVYNNVTDVPSIFCPYELITEIS